MCGIWFFLGNEKDKKEEWKLVKVRGPDSTNILEEDQMKLVFHRLAIHDTSIMGNQPFYAFKNGIDYILVCNGEIYNERELRERFNIRTESKSDCSILLHLYFQVEENISYFLDLIRGEYAILLIKKYPNGDREIMLATDLLGVRPLFVSDFKGQLTVSSLVKGFSKEDDKVQRVNPRKILRYKWVEKEKKLAPVEILDRNLRPWSAQPRFNFVCDLLFDCVKRRLSSDRPIGCLLSGGLDSSLVAAIAAQELKKENKRLKTFSIGLPGSPDLAYAKKVASHIDSDHTEFLMTEEEGLNVVGQVIWAIESWDTTTIRASIPQFLLAKKIAEQTNIKVLLNGDGADECQMGYLYFHKSPSIEEGIQERNRLLDDIYYFDGLRVDRCLTHFGLEARTPFLDQDFVRFFRDLPGEFLVPTKHRNEKNFIREAFALDHPDLLPREVLWRTKEAFSDGISPATKSWFSTLKASWEDEEDFYKKMFQSLFGMKKVIPYRWMPRWSDTKDPSARTLDFYASTGTKKNIP